MRKKELLKENENLKNKLKNLIKEYDALHNKISETVQERNKLENKIGSLQSQLFFITTLYEKAKKDERKISIEKIVPNEKKKAITVWFVNGSMQVVKCAKGVKFDLYSGVAYAIIKQLYKNNTQYKKNVDKNIYKKS